MMKRAKESAVKKLIDVQRAKRKLAHLRRAAAAAAKTTAAAS